MRMVLAFVLAMVLVPRAAAAERAHAPHVAMPDLRARVQADTTSARATPGLMSHARWTPLDAHLTLSAATPRGTLFASPTAGLGLTPTTRAATTLERLTYAADKGAFSGLALGTLGSWAGLWEEKTAWALMGAGAALGTLWGGLGDNVRITVAPRIDPDDPAIDP